MGLQFRDSPARYAAAAQPVFEAARDAALRLAGLLIAATMGRSRHLIDLPTRAAALEALAEAREAYLALVPPPAARHFHHHLSLALERLDLAFAAADAERAGKAGRDSFVTLRAAWTEMEAASRMLPGFETIDFTQSCCAWHQTRLAKAPGGLDGTLLNLDS